MNILKPVLAGLAIIALAVQVIRPETSTGPTDPSLGIEAAVPVPAGIVSTLRNSCYDCHSNETVYPWYAHVMPVGWYLADHIDHGKKHLNFSEFTSRSLRRQYHALEEIGEMVGQGEMPLSSYLILHRDAALSPAQRDSLLAWVGDARAAMRAVHPPDSLEARGRN